jgi:hypothetical protein
MMTFEADATYPHGKLIGKTLHGLDGYLLALQYKNPASLGKALSALGGEICWLPPENDRALIWLDVESTRRLPGKFGDRVTYLAQFEVAETKASLRSLQKARRSICWRQVWLPSPASLLRVQSVRFGNEREGLYGAGGS